MKFKDLKVGMKCIFKEDGDTGIVNGIKGKRFSVYFYNYKNIKQIMLYNWNSEEILHYAWHSKELKYFDFKSFKFDEDMLKLLDGKENE